MKRTLEAAGKTSRDQEEEVNDEPTRSKMSRTSNPLVWTSFPESLL